jgi:A/G-specific adenine glycosylase
MAKTPSAGPSDLNRTGPDRPDPGRLLGWYDLSCRPLPWRLDTDPYRVWLSEVMLQQTRVETVIPYFERFLSAFPSVRELAGAEVDRVHALWSGLGYYRRATLLHQAARQVVEAGSFPTTAIEWRKLPGVGRYTAAAVASICFGERLVALDGNLERVLTRLEAYPEDPKKAAGQAFLRAAGESWLDPERPGDSNQALMELGATVCLPTSPRCAQCPVSGACRARALGAAEEFPRRAKPGPKRRHQLMTICVRRGTRLLLFRRDSESSLLAGTWEAPWVRTAEDSPERALTRRYGGTWKIGKRLGALRHTITSRILTLEVYEGTVEGSGAIEDGREARWIDPTELEALPHSSLVRKVFQASANPAPSRASSSRA